MRKMVAAMVSLGLVVMLLAVVALAVSSLAVWPQRGDSTLSDNGLIVDVSHTDQGYVMVRGPKSDSRLKIRIAKGETVMTYDLNQTGDYETFPLQLGNGGYNCTLYKNVGGKKYSQLGKVSFNASLTDELSCYLSPNQYVDYTKESAAVVLADGICGGMTDPQKIYETVREHISSHYAYDFIRSLSIASGSLPDIDYVLEKKMGICQDLAALACCMLRSQGVPAQLAIGYANGKSYHAWVVVYINGKEELYDPTVDCKGIAKNPEYTFERGY